MNRQKLEYGALIAISVLTAAGGVVAMAVRVEKEEARRMRRWATTMGWAGIKTFIATPGPGAPRMACGLPRGFCMLTEEKEGGDSGQGSNAEKVDGGKTMIQVKFGEGSRLDKLLARERPSIPFSVIQKIIRNKKVDVLSSGGEWRRIKDPGQRVEGGDMLRVHSKSFIDSLGEPPIAATPKLSLTDWEKRELQSSVLLLQPEMFIVNKPAGLAVQGGSKTGRHLDRMLHALVPEGDPAPLLVHRLDRETSGCMAVGRTRGSAARISAAFSGSAGNVVKVYFAVVSPSPREKWGVIDAPLEKVRGSNGQADRVRVVERGGKRSVTEYEVLSSSRRGDAALLQIMPTTGRTHQIRVHCASKLKCPILGDVKYARREGGAEASANDKERPTTERMCLHARSIQITWESSMGELETVSASAPVPKHIWDAVDRHAIPVPPSLVEEYATRGG